MTEIQLSTQTRDAAVVVAVRGELDVVNSQQFDDYLAEASAGADRVVLDLSAVDFMDTSALAVVVSHWRRQVDAGGMFLLAGARYRYTKALWITGLADRLPLYDTVDDALVAARPEPGTGPATGTGPPAGDDAARDNTARDDAASDNETAG
jgi:anti-sigma B factor antagonist